MEYKEYELNELLPYEQPTPYIVESTDYNDAYKTPVLTAGKSFILGYTNETQGIFDQLPVIIFDDFTTATQFVNFKFKVKSSAMKILHINTEHVLPKYIFYRLQIIQFDHSTHKRYWIQQYSKIKIAVPPLDEQERIVSRIEELFSSLDNAVETLKKTKEQLAVYRQAVLKEAFNNISNTISMGDIAVMIDPQPSHRTPPEYKNGVPYIGIGDIDYDSNIIKFNDARKVSPSIYEEHIQRYVLQSGDFVMGKIGTIGKPFRLPLPQNYTLSANVILIQPNAEKINPEYLFWQFSSPFVTEQVMEGKNETSQPAFGIKKARLLQIRICTYEEQDRIVGKIREKISLCENITHTVETALHQAEAMRQSILKEAFEGRLA